MVSPSRSLLHCELPLLSGTTQDIIIIIIAVSAICYEETGGYSTNQMAELI